MYVCMYVFMYVCVCVCMYVCTCMYVCHNVCMYVCLYVCMYVSMSVCMYVCHNVCMYVYVCMYVCMYVRIYGPMYDLCVCVLFHPSPLPVMPSSSSILGTYIDQDLYVNSSVIPLDFLPSSTTCGRTIDVRQPRSRNTSLTFLV